MRRRVQAVVCRLAACVRKLRGAGVQVNDTVNKGLAQHLAAAEASLGGTAARLEAEVCAATSAMEAATAATLAAATAAAQASSATPAAPELATLGNATRYAGPSGTAPAARYEGREYPEPPRAQHSGAVAVPGQPGVAGGFAASQGAIGLAASPAKLTPAWPYPSQAAAAAPNHGGGAVAGGPPGFAVMRGLEPSAPPPPDAHPHTLPPAHSAPWHQQQQQAPPPQPQHEIAQREAAADMQYRAAVLPHGYHAPHAQPAAQPPPAAVAQPAREQPEGAPVHEMIARIVTALEKQDAAALADVCLQTPVALVQEMSQLHAAVIMHMLCPLISRDHGNGEYLLSWVRTCAERVAPGTVEQPKQVRLVFQTVLEAVEMLLSGGIETPQTRVAAIAAQRSIKERLAQFAE